VRADRALDYTGATPQPLVEAGSPVVTPAEGDGDAFLEAGESATVTIPASNVGDGTATGVSVTTQDDDPRTTITPRAQSYGDIAPGATAARDWTVELADAYPLGRPMSLSLRVAFAGRLSPTTSTVAIATGRPATTPTTFRYEGAPVPIPDASAAGASVTIPVSGLGYTSGVRFSIDDESCSTADGATTVGLDHTFVRDLTGTLTAPDGRTATLFEGSGGSGNNLCQVVFADRATESLTTATEARAPFTGTWRPIEPLAALVAGPADGDWTFRAIDTAARDTGSIRAVSLELSGFVADREVR
jgi:subtilisin-like proprotein convertase family protein